jgi:hypothetical protein
MRQATIYTKFDVRAIPSGAETVTRKGLKYARYRATGEAEW